jgi:lysyl-tRNA synthetase, class I
MADVSPQADWVSRFADEVIAESARRAPGKPVVVASGLSPSGPIHLGNLREVMVPHFVADEVRRRGLPCEHILPLMTSTGSAEFRLALTRPGRSTSASR